MVAEPTGPRSKADPKGQCSDGPGAAQVEELHNGRAGYPCDDGGLDGFLVTSFTPPIEVFKCQTHSERPGGRTFVHPVCLAILTPFTLSPCIQLVYGFRMIQTTLMGQFVLLHLDSSQRKFQTSALLRGTHFCRIFFCSSWDVCFIYRVLLFSYVFMLIKLCMLDLPTFTISNPNFTSGRLHLLCWIDDILDTENSFKCNRINSCWPKLPYGFGTPETVDSTISGCGPFSRCIRANPCKSNFWALDQALIQLNGNPVSALRLFVNLSTARKALLPKLLFRHLISLELSLCGGNCDGHLHLSAYVWLSAARPSTIVLVSGKRSST